MAAFAANGTAAAFPPGDGRMPHVDRCESLGASFRLPYTNGHTQTTAVLRQLRSKQYGILTTRSAASSFLREGYALRRAELGLCDGKRLRHWALLSTGDKAGMQGEAAASWGTGSNSGDVPSGFLKAAGSCPVSSAVNDVIDLKVQIRVPANAKGFSFDFDFWSGEWPDYVCTEFNDSFIAYLQSTACSTAGHRTTSRSIRTGTPSASTTTSSAYAPPACRRAAEVPTPERPRARRGRGSSRARASAAESLRRRRYCGGATSTSGGATSWLTSKAPVTPGEVITLEFLIWDTGDASYDSSVILDNFAWVPTPPMNTTIVSPPPPPPPPPK